MSGDEIVAGWPGRKIADVCEMEVGAIAERAAERGCAPVGEFEHFVAGVDEIHFDVGIFGKQIGEETAVAVTAEKSALGRFGVFEEGETAVLEFSAKGDALESLVVGGEAIAIHVSIGIWVHVSSGANEQGE